MRHVRILASVASLALVLGACGSESSRSGDPTGAGAAGSGGAGGDAASGGSTAGSGGSTTGSGGSTAGSGGGTAGSGGGTGGTAGSGGGTASSGGSGGGGGILVVDADGDGSMSDVDCDDTNPDVHPGADETCNGSDDNCDGQVDEGVKLTFYEDADQDGFGTDNAQTNLQGCVAPSGFSATAGDCDDASPAVNPGATEACNDADDDCDGQTDEGVTKTTYYPDVDGDGYGIDAGAQQTCTKPNGAFVTVNGDCDDADKDRFPGNLETCDGKDNDCDAATPDPGTTDWFKDDDGDSFGDPNQKLSTCAKPDGYVASSQDCNDGNKDVNPSAIEVCDGIDNNCVGGADEGPVATYPDADGDGYGDATAQPAYRCAADATHLTDNSDCDDSNKNIKPGATEIPGNGVDENCDGGDSALGTQCGPGSGGIATLPYQKTASLTAAANNKPGNPRGAGYYWDDYEIATKGGEMFTALMSSSSMKGLDPHLYYSANSCVTGASVQNTSWWSLHPVDHMHRSRLIVTSATAGYYDFITTEDAVKAGTYQFDVLPGQFGQTCGKQDLGIWPLGFRQTSTLDTTDVETGSPIANGYYAEDWEVWLDANQPYSMLYSATYTPYAALSSGSACDKAVAGMGGGIVNGKGARIVYTPTASGIYTAWATTTTAGATGSYSINVVPGNVGASCFAGNGNVSGAGDSYAFWPIAGSATESLGIGDRVDTWLGSRYFDDYETWLEAGESITLTMTASGFTPKLMLTSSLICTAGLVNADPSSGSTAALTYTATTSGIYTIVATSHAASAAGNYTLTGKYN